jgi:hypothetical protein
VRMWDYYLSVCEAGFATGILQDMQLGFEKRSGVRNPSPPLVRCREYRPLSGRSCRG